MAFFGLKSDIFRSFSSNLKIEYSSGACPKMSCQPRQRRFFSSDKAPGVCAGPQKRRIPGRLRGAAPPDPAAISCGERAGCAQDAMPSRANGSLCERELSARSAD